MRRSALVVLAFTSLASMAHAQSTPIDPTAQFHVSWHDANEPGRAAAEHELIDVHLALRELLSPRAQRNSAARSAMIEPRLRDVRTQLEGIVERAPALVTAWLDLAEIDFEMRDGTAMLRHLTEAEVRAGNGPMRAAVLFQLGIAHTMLDHFAEARATYLSALELPLSNTARGLSLCNLAEIETYLRAPDDSIAHYEACVNLLQGYDGGFWGLASAYDREGREYDAHEAAARALSIDATAASLTSHSVFYTPAYEVHYYLGLAREAQGRRDEALAEWQRYLDAGGANDPWAERARAHVRALGTHPSATPEPLHSRRRN